MKFNISDWVRSNTKNGELISGFIEKADILHGIVTVHVVESDNEKIVGKNIVVRQQWMKLIPDIPSADVALIHNQIDLALATRDEAWFMELTNRMKSVEMEESELNNSSDDYRNQNNRLGPVGR